MFEALNTQVLVAKNDGRDPASRRRHFLTLVEQIRKLPASDGARRLLGQALSEAGLAGLACGAPDSAQLLHQGIALLTSPEHLNSLALARNFAHDLRNPVSALLMNGEMLAEDPDLPEEELRDIGTGMVRIAQRLLSAVDVLSDYRRLQSGEWEPQIEPMSVATWVDMARQQVTTVADFKGIKVDFIPVSGRVMVDPEPALRALVAVLRHSIGFASKGLVVSATEENGVITLAVVDDGPPPGPHQLSLKLGGCLGRKVTGDSLNLSLTVATMLVERMGGRLTVSTARPVGAIFEMSFPTS